MKRNSILGLVAAMMMISCVGTKDVKYLQKNENLEINSEGLVPYNIPVYRVTKNDILSLNVITTPKGDAAQFYSSYNVSGGEGAGAGMLRNIPLMLDITRRVVQAVKTPVTVKTRLGWDSDNLVIATLAEQLQDCGIQALTIHGRTRAQMYTGQADWTLIAEVKRNPRIHIPIIGNGDISTPEDARLAFDTYGVDAVMIGRATLGRAWV